MKMVSNYGSNWKRTNVQLVSLACGLALATVAIVGGNEILRDKDSAVIIPPAALQPQFATASDADYASLGLAYLRSAQVTPESLVGPAEALGIGQPGEGTKSVEATLFDPHFAVLEELLMGPSERSQSVEATLIDPTDFGSLGIEFQLAQQGKTTESVHAAEAYAAFRPETSAVPQPQFGTAADAVYAAQSLGSQQAAVSLGDALGIGQPGEGTQSVAATFIDPTDFASSFANHSAAQQFGTAADAAYATESWQARASEAPLFGTMVDAVYVMEGEIQLP